MAKDQLLVPRDAKLTFASFANWELKCGKGYECGILCIGYNLRLSNFQGPDNSRLSDVARLISPNQHGSMAKEGAMYIFQHLGGFYNQV